MNGMKARRCFVAVVSVLCFLFYSCDGTNVVNVDNVDIVDLNDIRSEIQILPIKCDVPMDEIDHVMAYDDYIFLLGSSWKSIYCVQKDTVISILDAAGRGRGEYSYINDFAYSQDEHILYVLADKKLMRYSVPEMDFIGSADASFTSSTMLFLNPDVILTNCSFYVENGKDVYGGICRVSSKTGEVLERCYDLDFMAKKMLMSWDMLPMQGGIIFPESSLTLNRIMFFDTSKGVANELFSYSFNSNWKVPKRLVRLEKKDRILYAMEAHNEPRRLEGGHFPSLNDSTLVFWCFPIEGNYGRRVAVIVRDGKVTCRSYTVDGKDFFVSPSFLQNGYCVDIITPDLFEDVDETSLSPFAAELKRVVDAQPFDNPVFLYFKVE